jgi:hypothetical protein
MYFNFPDATYQNQIKNKFDFSIVYDPMNKLIRMHDRVSTFEVGFELQTHVLHLYHRCHDIYKSFVFMSYYLDLGIPDDPFCISPGRNGVSVEYFPNFDAHHHEIKDAYDYFSDFFFYKLFSALESLAHILNLFYFLKITRPSFFKVVEKSNLRLINDRLYKSLHNLLSDPSYTFARDYRDNITHNLLPNSIGSPIKTDSLGFTLGVGNYTKSLDVYSLSIKQLNLFGTAISVMASEMEKK